jgi:2-oxoglutarate dehydrogenase E1 component
MPHRGRLNVLCNVDDAKPYRAVFHEFQGGSLEPRATSAARAT